MCRCMSAHMEWGYIHMHDGCGGVRCWCHRRPALPCPVCLTAQSGALMTCHHHHKIDSSSNCFVAIK